MRLIICPICRTTLDISSTYAKCNRGHAFPIVDGIIDLMPDIRNDKELFDEERYWSQVADKGWTKVLPNAYIDQKLFEDYSLAFEHAIKIQWPDYRLKNIAVGEIGCGSGSAISHLKSIGFANVDYVGIDISIKMMKLAANEGVPKNWKTQFARISANTGVFKENSLDLVFSSSVLHYFELEDLTEWIFNSLKPNGLFVLNEPSRGNLFAKIGRRVLHNRRGFFHTSEKRLLPAQVKLAASKQNLHLVFEKGFHFLNGPLYYLFGDLNMPKPIVVCCYYIGRSIDYFVSSPSWSYSFIQVYKKG